MVYPSSVLHPIDHIWLKINLYLKNYKRLIINTSEDNLALRKFRQILIQYLAYYKRKIVLKCRTTILLYQESPDDSRSLQMWTSSGRICMKGWT